MLKHAGKVASVVVVVAVLVSACGGKSYTSA